MRAGLGMLSWGLVAATLTVTPTTHSQPNSRPRRAGPSGVIAQSGDSPVITLLLTGRDARTRIQAALSLSRMRPPGSREALCRALSDRWPTVRAAAAEALRSIGDPAAVPSLRARSDDPDPTVRSTVARALALLDRPSGSPPALGGANSTAGALAAVAPAPVIDWRRTRYVLRLGSLANRADQRSQVVDALRTAISNEVGRLDEIAVSSGDLPVEAARRLRSGRLRAYTIEGSVQQLRRWTVAATLSVRAEVSLVLMADPGRSLVGSMSGAATAQNIQSPGQSPDALAHDLELRAVTGAVRGAVANLRSSLGGRR